MIEVAEWVDIYTKPFAEDRAAARCVQTMHDNNNGDAVFTVFTSSTTPAAPSRRFCDPRARQRDREGDGRRNPERQKLWQEAFRLIHEEIVADVPIFHMVGYTRVGPRVDSRRRSRPTARLSSTATVNVRSRRARRCGRMGAFGELAAMGVFVRALCTACSRWRADRRSSSSWRG